MAQGKPIIYRIGNGDAHIVGAIHVLPSGEDLPDEYWGLQKSADCLLFEADLDASKFIDWERMRALDARKTLSEILPKELYQAGARVWAEGKLDGRFGRMQPWFVAMTLGNHVRASTGLLNEYGVDHQLWSATDPAKRDWLESIDQALAPMHDASKREIERMIALNVLTPTEATKRLRVLHEAWLNGDEVTFLSVHGKMFDETPLFTKALLDTRNMAWMPKIRSTLKERKSPLFVVGLLHLFGKNSLPELLMDSGIEVQRVS